MKIFLQNPAEKKKRGLQKTKKRAGISFSYSKEKSLKLKNNPKLLNSDEGGGKHVCTDSGCYGPFRCDVNVLIICLLSLPVSCQILSLPPVQNPVKE